MEKKSAFFHLHLISDSTGETLSTVSKAALARYDEIEPIEHIHPLVRTSAQLEKIIQNVNNEPGIVLYTLVDTEQAKRLELACRKIFVPCLNVLDPIYALFQSYLDVELTNRIGGQHALDTSYFQRIEALNYSMDHDDGQIPDALSKADVIIIGVSRSSKTPTCIYLANRGIKAANIPLILDNPLPNALFEITGPMKLGLVASVHHIQQIRQNRLLSLSALDEVDAYVDKKSISQEIAQLRKVCNTQGWPIIDVTRRSIEETAAEIMTLLNKNREKNHIINFTSDSETVAKV